MVPSVEPDKSKVEDGLRDEKVTMLLLPGITNFFLREPFWEFKL